MQCSTFTQATKCTEVRMNVLHEVPATFRMFCVQLGDLKKRADQRSYAGDDEHHAPKQQLTFKD